MTRRPRYRLSLANKCVLLFGLAVLSIMVATLFMPWVQMTGQNDEVGFRRAQQVAAVAALAVNLQGTEWGKAQTQLAERWPGYKKLFDLDAEVPRLITAQEIDAREGIGIDGFIVQKAEKLRSDSSLPYAWEYDWIDGQSQFRLVMAVRESDTEPHPGALRGVIEVRLPWPHIAWLNLVTVIGAGLSGMLLALLVFYLITHKLILSPVRDLRSVAEQVTRGDLEVRSNIKTADEFEELADAFNEMLTHLRGAQAELEKINRSLDIKLNELAETNVALFESNRVKSEFIGNVSHELRTPLVSIIGFAELLQDASADPPADKTRLTRYARNILSSGRMLLDLINDLLDLAKIEAGKMELHIVDFDIADVGEAVIEFYRPLADKKSLELTWTMRGEIQRLSTDAGRLKQVLNNLVSNAIKFTPDGGRVAVAAEAVEGDRIRLTVRDTGPGIPAELQGQMFEKFRQLDSSVTREHGGTGLGLAISKELCQFLGGEIALESEEDRGSTFIVTIPRVAPSRQVDRPLVRLTSN